MALQIRLIATMGMTIESSYARVDAITGSKDEITVSVSYYFNNAAAQSGKPYVQQEQYPFTPSISDDAPNFIKQAYEYLKTLPEFSGAIDA